MSAWWPYVEIGAKDPLKGYPRLVRPQDRGNLYSDPSPYFGSVTTFGYSVFNGVVFATCSASGGFGEMNYMQSLICWEYVMDDHIPGGL
jgi:hypothetical protein